MFVLTQFEQYRRIYLIREKPFQVLQNSGSSCVQMYPKIAFHPEILISLTGNVGMLPELRDGLKF